MQVAIQTEICLSSTDSEYTGLSYLWREAILIMELLQEMKDFPIHSSKPKVHCQVFEADNMGALEMTGMYTNINPAQNT